MRKEVLEKAEKIKNFLLEHKVEAVTLIDMSENCSWTDCFIIGTVNSIGHLQGVVRQLWTELKDLELSVNNRHKSPDGDGWELIDTGDIVIHLMSPELRTFYNLEKLWKVTEEVKEY